MNMVVLERFPHFNTSISIFNIRSTKFSVHFPRENRLNIENSIKFSNVEPLFAGPGLASLAIVFELLFEQEEFSHLTSNDSPLGMSLLYELLLSIGNAPALQVMVLVLLSIGNTPALRVTSSRR